MRQSTSILAVSVVGRSAGVGKAFVPRIAPYWPTWPCFCSCSSSVDIFLLMLFTSYCCSLWSCCSSVDVVFFVHVIHHFMLFSASLIHCYESGFLLAFRAQNALFVLIQVLILSNSSSDCDE